MGRYSTPLFLDRAVFPDLQRLVSIEDDDAWISAPADTRHLVLRLLNPVSVPDFDLVFIDNGRTIEERVEAIAAVAPLATKLVVIHDWERAEYRKAAAGLFSFTLADDATPQTALMWRTR